MKAERRHKLQTNTLAQAISDFPTFWKDYGSKIALWGALGILLIVVLYYRFSGTIASKAADLQALSTLRDRVDALRFSPAPDQPSLSPQQWQDNSSAADELLANLKQLKDGTSDKRIKAEALVEMGDADWNLANAPVASATDSADVAFPTTRSKLLEDARDSYQQVVDLYSDQPLSYVSARFGLAAIAESLRDYTTAREQYDAIGKAYNVDPLLKDRAAARLAALKDLQRPVYLGTTQTYEPFVLPDNIRYPATRSSTGVASPTTGVASPTVPPTTMPTTTAVNIPVPTVQPVQPAPATMPTTMP